MMLNLTKRCKSGCWFEHGLLRSQHGDEVLIILPRKDLETSPNPLLRSS